MQKECGINNQVMQQMKQEIIFRQVCVFLAPYTKLGSENQADSSSLLILNNQILLSMHAGFDHINTNVRASI